MRTMILQYIVSLLMLGFGVVGLVVARRLVHPTAHRLAWTIAGTAFTAAGVSKLAQNVFGTFALAAGAGSSTWDLYLRWAPAFDHSRTGILATLFLLLSFLLVPHRSWAAVEMSGYSWRRWAPILVAGGITGATVGWAQGWDHLRHFRNVVLGDTAELLLALAALLALLLRDRVDRLLWLALSLYATSLAINALWFSAWVQTSRGGGMLSPAHMNASRILIGTVMVWLALRRVAFATRGAPVPSLLASLPLRGTFPRRML